MNIKQYFSHLFYWIRKFPRWSDAEHTTTGIAGSGEYYCLLCDYVEIEEPDTDFDALIANIMEDAKTYLMGDCGSLGEFERALRERLGVGEERKRCYEET